MTLDSTQIKMFLECPFSWYIQYVMKLDTLGRSKEALHKGSLMHLALETYYHNPSPEVAQVIVQFFQAIKRANGNSEKLQRIHTMWAETFPKVSISHPDGSSKLDEFILDEKTYDFVMSRFLAYVNYYEDDMIEPLNQSSVEVGFSREIGKFSDGEPMILEGKIDVLAKDRGADRVRFWDHKTQGRKSDLYPNKVQFRTYDLALNFGKSDIGYGGINYIGLTEKFDNETLRRRLMYFTVESRHQWLDYVRDFVFIPARATLEGCWRDGVLPTQRFGSCAGAFESTPCKFHQICEETGNEITSAKQQLIHVGDWRPW